jgi:hypothetical protein
VNRGFVFFRGFQGVLWIGGGIRFQIRPDDCAFIPMIPDVSHHLNLMISILDGNDLRPHPPEPTRRGVMTFLSHEKRSVGFESTQQMARPGRASITELIGGSQSRT